MMTSESRSRSRFVLIIAFSAIALVLMITTATVRRWCGAIGSVVDMQGSSQVRLRVT